MAYKISKSDDAPEGDLRVSIGSATFKVSDDKPYETDDIALVEAVETSYSEYFVVENLSNEDLKAAARAEAKAARELAREQAKVDKQRAEKEPTEAAPEMPTTVEDLKSEGKGE